ncbi:hypothetical protein TSUD_147950 [Trifolium subterraneum]|uniref:Reverse transcriptase zinc-binding domain-containing protein n=1 Tax=Trifolium subterraneum TaxID=3900 RepID=A0A2Z6P946_TRISU|nr:hypothetical protein TSUD_147950 [Trifolium subterraneum]
MKATVESNLFTGYSVGVQDPITVLHLQFAYDTLLLGAKCWANIRALRAVLVLFELMSGLKRPLYGVMWEMAFPLSRPSYWGDLRRLGFWEPVLTRIKNRLLGWKSRFLSFGGRFILLKSVLTSLPVYAFSFFKAPSGIISSIESLLNKIFWGGSEDARKISWISWKNICSRKEYEGLGVRQLQEFNIALLGKWCWRMLVDKEGLWFRVLAARYGTEIGRVREGGMRGSSWWREIVNIWEGRGDIGVGWFGDCISKKVGEGSGTLFWTDPWLEGIPLSERFGRLFDLAMNKSSSVAEMFDLGWEVGGEAWEWRRQLWAWEEELVRECQDLLHDLSLQAHSPDVWQWQPDPTNGYSVHNAYQILISQEITPLSAAADLIWHK